jgi:hypothetical protein
MNRPEERTSSMPEARDDSFFFFSPFIHDCFPVLLFSTLFLFSSLLFLTDAGPSTEPKFDDLYCSVDLDLELCYTPDAWNGWVSLQKW